MRAGRIGAVALVCAGCAGVQTAATARPVAGPGPQPEPGVPSSARPFIPPRAYASYVRAEVLAERGEHAQAVAAYRISLDEGGPDPWVQARMARAMAAGGDRTGAMDALADALDARPDASVLWLTRGELLAGMGQTDAAIYHLLRAVDLTPARAEPAIALARLLDAEGQPERAIAVLDGRAQHGPVDGVSVARTRLERAVLQGDLAGMERAISRLVSLRAIPRRGLTRLARAQLARGEPQLAVALLERLPGPATPDQGAIHARALLASAEYARAATVLDTLPEDSLGGRLQMARAWLEAQRPERALAVAQRAVVMMEGLEADRARLVAAQAWLALGRPDAAARTVVEVGPDSPLQPDARALIARALDGAGLTGIARRLTDEPSGGINAGKLDGRPVPGAKRGGRPAGPGPVAEPTGVTRGVGSSPRRLPGPDPSVSTRRTDPGCARPARPRSCTAS